MIKVTYDKEADASYIYLQEAGGKDVEKTYACNPSEINGMINLDFDKEGKLLGIEIMDASKKLSEEFLNSSFVEKI